MGMTAGLTVDIAAILTKALDLVNPASIALPYRKVISWADGVGADQADILWHDQRTLSASASEDLDLRGGVTSAFGDALNFVEITLLLIYAALANTNNVHVGGTPANGITTFHGNVNDINVVRPGGLLVIAARDGTGYATTAGTADLLRVLNSAGGTSVTYDVVVAGRSA